MAHMYTFSKPSSQCQFRHAMGKNLKFLSATFHTISTLMARELFPVWKESCVGVELIDREAAYKLTMYVYDSCTYTRYMQECNSIRAENGISNIQIIAKLMPQVNDIVLLFLELNCEIKYCL
jgi:hypothetical protein